jgi:hypothetical protein
MARAIKDLFISNRRRPFETLQLLRADGFKKTVSLMVASRGKYMPGGHTARSFFQANYLFWRLEKVRI